MKASDLSDKGRALRLQPGQAVCVAVRLERARLAKPSAAEAGAENRLTGEVTELIYLGRSRKYVIRTGSAAVIVVQEIQNSSDPVFAAGRSVAVHWSAEDAMALTGI